ncbi:hypothetical protein O181_115616 [Austropuccinia psidii MF-1]|uniref:Uncharacterized protein n=1 Tax=Austropuccinia psidii MF-1 TaxID=1389203 RepID=A0A9Q3PWC2_9BASI|nr:hypothetical protein [Austropuccinia psidii MF-1]
MSVSTHSKKAADDDTNAKPLSNEEVYLLLNSLKSEVLSLKSARSTDTAEVQSLCMQLLSPPPPGASLQLYPHVNTSAYKPYRSADRFPKLQGDGSRFAEWISLLNHILCIAFNSKALIDDSPSFLEGQSPQENWAISHFINASIPHEFALCIGIIPLRAMAKEFFDAIKACCCPGSRFHKLRVVRKLLQILTDNASNNSKTNTSIVLPL